MDNLFLEKGYREIVENISNGPFAVVLAYMRKDGLTPEQVGFAWDRSHFHFLANGSVFAVVHVSHVAAYYNAGTTEEVITELENVGFLNTGRLAE